MSETISSKPGMNPQGRFSGHPYLSGDIDSVRVDAVALALPPLAIQSEDGRSAWQLERVVPGQGLDLSHTGPIEEAQDRWDLGDRERPRLILAELLEADLRCLDAHALLGEWAQGLFLHEAISHFEVGMRIAELSLNEGFDGVLPWELQGNQPYLRCLRGYALCLWGLKKPAEAVQGLERLLQLDPSDGVGAAELLRSLHAGVDAKVHLGGGRSDSRGSHF